MAKQRRKSWKIRPEELVSKQSHKQNNFKKSYKTTRDLKSHDDTKIKKVYKLGIESINHQESEKKKY
jgi:predicted small secreted protein